MPALKHTTELMRLLSEPTRLRLLAVLAHEELTVAELMALIQLGQSRVSTHLGKLREAGLVRDRRVGASSYYTLNESGMPPEAERLWTVLLETTRDPVLEQDRQRAQELVRVRQGGPTWADAVAGRMQRHYSPGRTWEATARGVLGLCRLGDVLDVASGDGVLAELIAPRAGSVTCLDLSKRVINAARKRLAHLPNVRFVLGDMHALPFEDESFDAVMLMNCLTYAEHPRAVVVAAARVLRPGGLLVGVTLKEHSHRRVVEAYNHIHLGFRPTALRKLLLGAGFEVDDCEVSSREQRPPHFEVVTFHGRLPERAAATPRSSRKKSTTARSPRRARPS